MRRQNKGGPVVVIMVKTPPHGGALGCGGRGHRNQGGKGKETGSSSGHTPC